ncbi:hypothetical protein VTN31DRAFT_6744 [Thermomyces dupontii]|uniref:uncharacterized protein n=1 Tax=Talaromyces thermophilus TaxID=28565 RepID=UPI003743372E
MYDRNPDKRSWLTSDALPWHHGPRPQMGPHPAPQSQLDQAAGAEIPLKLGRSLAQLVADNQHLLVFKPSVHEGRTTQGVFLADEVERLSIAEQMDG